MRGKLRSRANVLMLCALLAPAAAKADVVLPEKGVPLPFFRPDVDTESPFDGMTTGSVPVQLASAVRIGPPSSGDVSVLRDGLEAVSRGDIPAARAVRDGIAANALDRTILEWAIALSGSNAVSSAEINRATTLLAGWPGMAALRRNTERALYDERPDPDTVIDAFAGHPPETTKGVIALARAYMDKDDTDAAIAAVAPFWRIEKLSAKDELLILQEFGALIPVSDHRFRMERMLHADRFSAAARVSGFAKAAELADAWEAVTRNAKDADRLLEAVPLDQRSAGYVFAQAKRLRRTGHFKQAAATMAKAPKDAVALVDPDAWWVERRVLSRELLDIGETRGAYEVAAAHSAESPTDAADAEFHAGWYALRGLRDAKTAATHFNRIIDIADGPISLARAYYWLGRAAEAGGPGEAVAFYEKAATYGTAFYGQLAASKLGRGTISAPAPEPSMADRASFTNRVAVRAIERLERADQTWRADILYRDLASELTSPGELALLAAMAEARGNHYLALRIGKIAAARGIDIGALTHPVGAIPLEARISGAGQALAYAVARQESEFNVSAKSGAGALGLLQLLPGTAKEMARKAGLSYEKGRLTTDAGYNATLGAAFLSEQLDRFDGSYILTFAGYNAGPRRALDWMERYGDPRGKDIETVVDWIERIPFTETRGYVQRVMENYQVYKMRLTGRADIASDLIEGRH